MTRQEILERLEVHFQQNGQMEPDALIHFQLADGDWLAALCVERETAADYMIAFEEGMQTLIRARQVDSASVHLALAVDFSAVEKRERPSYRKALKKYSNSIVFEDLGISILLVTPQKSRELKPVEVNSFLSDLDRHVQGG